MLGRQLWLGFDLVDRVMHYNSQRPENIPPPLEPVGVLTGVRIWPILVGVVVDYVTTFLFGTIYLIVQGIKNGDLSEEAIKKILASPESLIVLGVIGTLCVVLGGYIAGRLAKGAEVKHATLVGLASLVLVTLEEIMLGEGTPVPPWYEAAGYLITVPAAALGGYFAQRQHELRAAYPPAEGPWGRPLSG